MALTDAQKQSRYDYAKKNLKRIPLDVQKEKYEEIKAASEKVWRIRQWIYQKSLDERMERDTEKD